MRKGAYSYDDWEKINEVLLAEKENFYSHLNMKDITDADYAHTNRVCKDFKIKNLGDYLDLYLQSDTLVLIDVFENSRSRCLEIMSLILHIFFCTRISMASSLKKTKSKVRSFK